jgi:hypothetical protein
LDLETSHPCDLPDPSNSILRTFFERETKALD